MFRLYTTPLFVLVCFFSLERLVFCSLHPFVVNKISISNVMFGFSCNELALYCYQMYHIHIYFFQV